MTSTKVEEIRAWSTCEEVVDVQSFMDLPISMVG